mgnify:CR=1 FL=1
MNTFNINFEELNKAYEEKHNKKNNWEDEWNKICEEDDKEEKELDEISKKGIKKKDTEKYYESLSCPECFNCFNLDREHDICKVGSGYDYMNRDREECIKWESIYEPEEKE